VETESQLVEAAKRGSVEAFTKLIGTYREGLFRFLLTRCASRADAEDALQDTLVNAYRYLGTYKPQWRFSTWLYRIAIRNAGRTRNENVALLDDPVDDAGDPLSHCIADSERDNLWRAAKRSLSDEVFAAMWLRYVQDMSIRDIAGVLDRSSSWTKVNLHRGRQALEAEMKNTATNSGSEAYG
jgi:RNA polymerase sigma-70 factor (ECF subfamily)